MIKRRWQVSARKNILLLALVLDTLFGDPPNRFHPSAGMGKLIAYAMRFRPRGNPFAEFVFGTGIALSGSVLVTGIGKLLEKGLGKCYGGYRNLPCLVVEAAILKSTFSLRGLNKAAGEVQVALESGDLPTARRSLSSHTFQNRSISVRKPL